MSAFAEIKDMTAWNSTPVNTNDLQGQGSLAEITQYLREIRDLQKAHFERYQEFTSKILAGEKTRAQEAERLVAVQHQFQEQARQAAFTRQMVSWAVWVAIVVLTLGSMLLFQLFSPFGF